MRGLCAGGLRLAATMQNVWKESKKKKKKKQQQKQKQNRFVKLRNAVVQRPHSYIVQAQCRQCNNRGGNRFQHMTAASKKKKKKQYNN